MTKSLWTCNDFVNFLLREKGNTSSNDLFNIARPFGRTAAPIKGPPLRHGPFLLISLRMAFIKWHCYYFYRVIKERDSFLVVGWFPMLSWGLILTLTFSYLLSFLVYQLILYHFNSLNFDISGKYDLWFYILCYWFFQTLEDRDRKSSMHKDQLNREHRYLRRKLDQLSSYHAMTKRRSLSECSSSTVSSGISLNSQSSIPSPISETGKFLHNF